MGRTAPFTDQTRELLWIEELDSRKKKKSQEEELDSTLACILDRLSASEMRIINLGLQKRKTEMQTKERLARRHTANGKAKQYLGQGFFAH